jgi:nucleotide-binding universal stress UspA family protein
MKTIVVGYSDTDDARKALDRAIELAKAFGAQLVVTSVAPVVAGGPRSMGALDPADDVAEHRDELAHARSAVDETGLSAEFVVGVGEPAEAIVELAEKRSADVIVVGTRDAGILERLLGGSVSASVSRQASCDVLVVR